MFKKKKTRKPYFLGYHDFFFRKDYIFQTYKKNVSKFWANKGSGFVYPCPKALAATYTGSSGGQNPLFLMAEGISDGQGK